MKQKQLMEWIAMLGLCAVDMQLYLDTHPTDKDALEYYDQCVQMLNTAKQKYEANFGPLTADASCRDRWTWVETPMPWEVTR
ncbi:MAG: spore coat protein CotJB [Lachnospiraceae bacterium]|nr:spore coat protein CotJB [Lachnospiraceae bacterium]